MNRCFTGGSRSQEVAIYNHCAIRTMKSICLRSIRPDQGGGCDDRCERLLVSRLNLVIGLRYRPFVNYQSGTYTQCSSLLWPCARLDNTTGRNRVVARATTLAKLAKVRHPYARFATTVLTPYMQRVACYYRRRVSRCPARPQAVQTGIVRCRRRVLKWRLRAPLRSPQVMLTGLEGLMPRPSAAPERADRADQVLACGNMSPPL